FCPALVNARIPGAAPRCNLARLLPFWRADRRLPPMQDLPPNPLPGVPLVESPLFRQFFNEDTCDRETLRIAHDLPTHGCALLDFPDPEIATRAARIRQALHGRYDWAAWRERRLDSLRIQDAWEFDADVKAIAVNPRMLA